MTTDYVPALRTSPLRFLIVEELLDAIHLYVIKVINHTHVEKSLIAFIDMQQFFAGESPAFITIGYFPVEKQ
jgi:hypothetical protein